MSKKAWSVNGKFRIAPKDDGAGVMVSAFQSREFGFGMDISDEEYVNINRMRKGTMYHDKIAANNVYKLPAKGDLVSNPFVRLFNYGNTASKEGYWTYNYMVLQWEDIIDVL